MASMTGGRPGNLSSSHSATKTGHDASGLTTPTSASCLRVAFAGSGKGRVGFVATLVFARNLSFALRVWARRFAVYVSWVY